MIQTGAERSELECEAEGDFSYTTLTLQKDGADVRAIQVDALGWTEIKELVPQAPLEPNTTYTLRLSAEEPNAKEITFTTGTRLTASAGAAPTLEIVEAWEDSSVDKHDNRAIHRLSFRVTPGEADPSSLSLLRLTADGWNHAVFAVGPNEPLEGNVHYWGTDGEPICMTVVQVAANGAEVASEEVCKQPVPAGCHAGRDARSSNGMWVVGLALVALRVGRRRMG